MSIFDIEGKEQMRTQIPVSQIVFKKKIDLLQDGMYLIRIICDDKIIESLNFIVQK
ncbi:MAG: T9SS type A sorting domain-containing protein [Bacteroidetes bacterium]|nr:T9SS type A sorting domain-containing protein [Bacteroidota bacterium]MBL0256437.1 T9SS type A sorting domain-containing protein [Bacteroidota bacterium]